MLRQHRGPLPVLQGTVWTHFTRDPLRTNFKVDSEMGLALSWYTECPDYGMIINHPVRIEFEFLDHELFFSGYVCPFNLKNLKDFKVGFPSYPSDGDCAKFLSYHHQLT